MSYIRYINKTNKLGRSYTGGPALFSPKPAGIVHEPPFGIAVKAGFVAKIATRPVKQGVRKRSTSLRDIFKAHGKLAIAGH
jgi:hypothetical protein